MFLFILEKSVLSVLIIFRPPLLFPDQPPFFTRTDVCPFCKQTENIKTSLWWPDILRCIPPVGARAPTRPTTLEKKNHFFVSQHLSIANSSLARNSMPCFPPHAGFGQASQVRFMQVITLLEGQLKPAFRHSNKALIIMSFPHLLIDIVT